VPLNVDRQIVGSVWDLLSPYALLGGLTTGILFALHGAVFLVLKTGGEVRADAQRIVRLLLVPTAVIVGGFGVWTQLAYGAGWTWAVLVTAVLGLVLTGAANAAGRDGWAFVGTTLTVISATVLIVGSMYPNVLPSTISPLYDLNIYNASSTPYTLKVMSWAALLATPVVLVYQGWTYWVFRQRLTVEQIPAPTGLPLIGKD
ncbi:cytochrome d ubiquinol oxidase subunit II, partial [Nocardia sp. NPDC058497]|uniref:cytochrome d ubiquinol oxidase subunit II n=1 Tax=Nocardia sp. NPDC058497 TaxID=3346529 RepID=UPI00364668DF